jgi:acetyl-CoA acetyltransferase
MDRAVIIGVGMTQFTRHPDRSMKDLGREAIEGALADAGIDFSAVEAVFFGNALAGATSGQHCIRGETVIHAMGHGTLPVTNVENACASSGNALQLAWSAVAGGQYQTALAVGAEKMFFPGKRTLAFEALGGALDVDQPHELAEGAGTERSPFMDLYASRARRLIRDRGVTVEGLARVAVKARFNGSLNPLAQKQTAVTLAEVLQSRSIVEPLTLFMCAPVGDGAAAAVVTRRPQPRRGDIEILASQLSSLPSAAAGSPTSAMAASRAAYEQAGLGPTDIDVVEVHDATTAGEMVSWVDTGLCQPGDEEKWSQTGYTELSGHLPINPSGGLIARGHPIGASGIGQIYELVTQLRGNARKRQVPNARVALAQVGGGSIGTLTAAAAIHILRAA